MIKELKTDIKFKQEYYNEIIWNIGQVFKIKKISKKQFLIWKCHIKELFLKNFLIKEIVAAIKEAGNKKNFPYSTGFFKKIELIILKNRRENKIIPRFRSDQFESLNDILSRYHS